MLKILTILTTFFLTTPVFAQVVIEEIAPKVSFELGGTFFIPTFKPADLNATVSSIVSTLCEDDEAEACTEAKAAATASQQQRLSQMLAAQATLEQSQFDTMVAIGQMQRDDATELAVRSANILAETRAFGDQNAAMAANLLNETKEEMVDVDLLKAAKTAIADLEAAAAIPQEEFDPTSFAAQQIAVQEEALKQVVKFMASMQATCDTKPTVSWCGNIAGLPDMNIILGTN